MVMGNDGQYLVLALLLDRSNATYQQPQHRFLSCERVYRTQSDGSAAPYFTH